METNRDLICYLCGEPIVGAPSMDHVPPQQLFAPDVRRQVNLDRLTTLPTHATCNRAFAHDEEYTVAALVSISIGSPAADALVRHQAKKFRAGKFQGLARKILGSFQRRPSGLVLPKDRVALRLEGERVKRVIWKIVRGLYFIETGSVLPENTTFMVEMREPDNDEPSDLDYLWENVKATESKGTYQGVFTYKYLPLGANVRLHAWAMIWWGKFIWFAAHDDPGATVVPDPTDVVRAV